MIQFAVTMGSVRTEGMKVGTVPSDSSSELSKCPKEFQRVGSGRAIDGVVSGREPFVYLHVHENA